MNPDFSERQYETAVNQEICRTLKGMLASPLPVIPSTNEERDLGWDAKFGVGYYWYFLQYKVASYATRRTGGNSHFWDAHGRDYFRFELLSNSNRICHQHQRLAALRATQPGVYYCVPYFVREEDFWAHAASEDVFWNSALIDLDTVPLPSPRAPHQISYDLDGRVRVWSEPGAGSDGNRSPDLRRSAENLRRLIPATVSTLIADAAAVLAGDALTPVDDQAEFVVRRLPAPSRERIGNRLPRRDPAELGPALAEQLSLADLVLTAGRIMALDFESAFVIEPQDLRAEF